MQFQHLESQSIVVYENNKIEYVNTMQYWNIQLPHI